MVTSEKKREAYKCNEKNETNKSSENKSDKRKTQK